MYRPLALCLALCLAAAITGCQSRPEPTETTPDIQYVMDQSEVKTLPERNISTEPLSTFREKLEAKRAESAGKSTTSEPASGKSMASDAADKAKPDDSSVWGKVKSLFGQKSKSGAKAADKPATAGDDSKKSSGGDGWGDDGDAAKGGGDKNDDNSNDDGW